MRTSDQLSMDPPPVNREFHAVNYTVAAVNLDQMCSKHDVYRVFREFHAVNFRVFHELHVKYRVLFIHRGRAEADMFGKRQCCT